MQPRPSEPRCKRVVLLLSPDHFSTVEPESVPDSSDIFYVLIHSKYVFHSDLREPEISLWLR